MRGEINQPRPAGKPMVVRPVLSLWPSRRTAAILAACVVVIAALIWGGLWFSHRHNQQIEPDHYQAVYLVTGQIYFGKLQNTGGTYLTLNNAYTVQNSNSSNNKDSAMAQNLIVKVSDQVYGPENSLAIRADQVQFWQNLTTTSKVVKAIESAPGE